MDNILAGILLSTIRTMIPLCLAAMGGIFSARVGIMALGLEGMMLMGAFGGALGTFYSGSPVIGIITGVLLGGLIGLCHGILTTKFKVNHVISGVGFNLLSAGITTLLLQSIWGNRGNSEMIPTLTTIKIPGVGGVSPLLIVMLVIAFIAHIFLYRNRWGLRLRMVGENPAAAESVGISIRKYKYMGAMVTGLLAGLAGTYLSVGLLGMFVRDMSAGRGYMAVCANVLGQYTPIGVVLSSLLFGLSDSMQIFLQGFGFPNRLIQLLPYFVTLICLVFAGKYVRPPQSLGKNLEE